MAANEEIDVDNMNEEEFESLMGDLESGVYDEDETQEEEPESTEIVDEIADDGEDEEDTTEDTTEDNEDTDQDDESEDEDDTNDQSDGDDDDTSDDTDEDEEEDTPVEDEDKETEDEDSETKEPTDDEVPDTVKIDQTEYDKYKKFYDEVVNAEFTANGKKVKGFTDPAKIIQSQQMAYGYSDKMAGFKQYKPFMMPLKDKGYLDDPDKFNFLMDLADGNVDALKTHIKQLEIDPLDMDLDEVNYKSAEHRASESNIALDETLEKAKAMGVHDKLQEVVGGEWDEASVKDFIDTPEIRNDLVEHMSNGVYDMVQDKIREMKSLDGNFADQKNVNQYRAAYGELVKEYQAKQETEQKANTDEADKAAEVEAEKAKLIEEQKAEKYKQSVAKKNKQIDEQRKKATSVAKRKKPVKKSTKFDPMKLDGDELDSFVDSLING